MPDLTPARKRALFPVASVVCLVQYSITHTYIFSILFALELWYGIRKCRIIRSGGGGDSNGNSGRRIKDKRWPAHTSHVANGLKKVANYYRYRVRRSAHHLDPLWDPPSPSRYENRLSRLR
jgi:hypothetical protein